MNYAGGKPTARMSFIVTWTTLDIAEWKTNEDDTVQKIAVRLAVELLHIVSPHVKPSKADVIFDGSTLSVHLDVYMDFVNSVLDGYVYAEDKDED